MKLHFAAASPYVRKVRVVADELGLTGQIELVSHSVTPLAPVDLLNAANPLGKIPALDLSDGTTLFDSRVITEYLNDIGGGGLLPQSGRERRRARVHEAQGDGICDALVLTRYETFLRPQALRWPDWIKSQLNKATRTMDQLEASADEWTDSMTIGTIAIACALSYADFRFDELGWRNERPKLAAWHERMMARSSMANSGPE